MCECLARFDIIVHCVEEAVEGFKFSLEPHQHQKLQSGLCSVEQLLSEVVVDVDLHETLISCVLVMRVGSNAAHSVVCISCHEDKSH